MLQATTPIESLPPTCLQVPPQCGAISLIYQGHHYTDDWDSTMRAALHDGGTDTACDSAYPAYLLAAYNNGSVSLGDLQAAGTNFLRQAFELGLLDPPEQASATLLLSHLLFSLTQRGTPRVGSAARQ